MCIYYYVKLVIHFSRQESSTRTGKGKEHGHRKGKVEPWSIWQTFAHSLENDMTTLLAIQRATSNTLSLLQSEE